MVARWSADSRPTFWRNLHNHIGRRSPDPRASIGWRSPDSRSITFYQRTVGRQTPDIGRLSEDCINFSTTAVCSKTINTRLGTELREKGRDLTQSYDKNPYIARKIKHATRQHKIATKTSITQRLRTDSGRSVGVVKPVSGISTFPLTTQGHIFKKIINNLPYKGRGPAAN